MEFKGVAVGLAQLNHAQRRRDLKNLQASGSFCFSLSTNQEQYNKPYRKSRHNHEAVPLLQWPADPSFQGSPLAASADGSEIVVRVMLRANGTMQTRCCILIRNFHYLIVALLNIEAHGSCCCFDFRQYLICRKPWCKPCFSLNRTLVIQALQSIQLGKGVMVADIRSSGSSIKNMNIPFASQRVCRDWGPEMSRLTRKH